uniref:WDR90 4th beta-propeller domain-containing protein n=1 Tax=Hemiselmis andersenii TaxID=464988 RepID=A0A7S1EF89_HEMAN
MTASCDIGGAVCVWATSGMEHLRTFRPAHTQCRCIAFSPDGKSIAAGYDDGVVRILAVGSAAGTTSDAMVITDGAVTAVSFDNHGESVVCGASTGAIAVAHVGTGRLQAVSACPPTASPVVCLRRSGDGHGTWLATCANGLLRVFKHDLSTGSSTLILQDVLLHEAPVFADFSPSEPGVILCGGPGLGPGIYFYDITVKRIVKRFVDMDQVASSLAVSPTGTLITIGTQEMLVKVVDYDEGTFQDFTGHSDAVSSMVFGPTGGVLLTAADTDIVQWSVRI